MLLKTAIPYADESFMGYILRLTERNSYSNPSWILEIGALNKPSSKSYAFAPLNRLGGLAELTGVSAIELAQLTYPPVIGQSSEGLYWFLGQPVPEYIIRPQHPKICPACLSESRYCSRMWELSLVTTCPKHQCLLIDECPGCKRRISWSREHVSVCRCKYDWRGSPFLPVEETELALTLHLHRLCGLPLYSDMLDQNNWNPALTLTLRDLTLALALAFIAGQYKGISSATSKNLPLKGQNKNYHSIFTKSFSVFEDWPNNYYRFLRWRNSQESDNLHKYRRSKSVLYTGFGTFYTGLYKILSARQFEFLKSEFLTYLMEHWEGCQASDLNYKKPAISHSVKKYVSKTDAMRLLGVDSNMLNQIVRQQKLNTAVQSKGKKRLIFIGLAGLTDDSLREQLRREE